MKTAHQMKMIKEHKLHFNLYFISFLDPSKYNSKRERSVQTIYSNITYIHFVYTEFVN